MPSFCSVRVKSDKRATERDEHERRFKDIKDSGYAIKQAQITICQRLQLPSFQTSNKSRAVKRPIRVCFFLKPHSQSSEETVMQNDRKNATRKKEKNISSAQLVEKAQNNRPEEQR